MSPQLAPSVVNRNECQLRAGFPQQDVTATATGVVTTTRICMSNSQIAQAADEAFSHHMRLDLDVGNYHCCESGDIANPLEMGTPKSRNRLTLKKRKKLFESVHPLSHEGDVNATSADTNTCTDTGYFPLQTQNPAKGLSNFDTDFVSGLFRDLSEATEDPSDSSIDQPNMNQYNTIQYQSHESNCITDDEFSRPRASKRLKSTGRFSMTRSAKSFTRLPNIDLSSTAAVSKDSQDNVHYQMCQHRVSTVTCNKNSSTPMDAANTSSSMTLNTDLINNLVDKVLIDTIPFPCIPPTVSEASCSSNNLTQTAVKASQVLENSNNNLDVSRIEGGKHDQKDTYGWFVDTDLQENCDRADVVSAAQETCRAGSICGDLSFKAYTAPKKTSDHEEVEWAKAADTVDDVLGDFF